MYYICWRDFTHYQKNENQSNANLQRRSCPGTSACKIIRTNIVDCNEISHLVIGICRLDTYTCLSTALLVRLYADVLTGSEQNRVPVVRVSKSFGKSSISLILRESAYRYRWAPLSWLRSDLLPSVYNRNLENTTEDRFAYRISAHRLEVETEYRRFRDTIMSSDLFRKIP